MTRDDSPHPDPGTAAETDGGRASSPTGSSATWPLGAIESYVGSGTQSGAFAAVPGTANLVRAARSYLKGDRRAARTRLLLGLLWIGIALAQRRHTRHAQQRREEPVAPGVDVDPSDVADTSPDIEDVAGEAGGRGADLGSEGEPADAVDPTTVDIEESDTAPEVESDVDAADVTESDVVDTGTAAEELEESSADGTEDSSPEGPEGSTRGDDGEDEPRGRTTAEDADESSGGT